MLTDFSFVPTHCPTHTFAHALHYFAYYTYTYQRRCFTMTESSPLSSPGPESPKRTRPLRSTRNPDPRHTKSQILDWKPRKTPLPEPLPIPAASQPPPKRTRQNSIAASTLSPDPIEQTSQVPKTADAPRPRHSLPKAKPITKKPRASMSNGQTRSQPTRGDNQAAATPIITPDSRPAKTPREDLPAKTLRTKPMEQSPSQTIAVREEASHILARANEHRELTRLPPALSSPDDDETTPASSMRFFRPASLSRTGYVEARIKLSVDDEAESEDFDAAFEAEFEKVKDAYRQGIQPWNNPYAPQEHSVPVYGLEDAEPPEWTEDQSPSMVLSTHRDRIYPEDIVGLAHRLGYDGLTEALAKDAHGFVENVKVCAFLGTLGER